MCSRGGTDIEVEPEQNVRWWKDKGQACARILEGSSEPYEGCLSRYDILMWSSPDTFGGEHGKKIDERLSFIVYSSIVYRQSTPVGFPKVELR